jgi:RNA polymerase sigma-70 factor (ECF subfamily)
MSRQSSGAAARADPDPAPSTSNSGDRIAVDDVQAPRPGGLEALYRQHAAWLTDALRRRFGREAAEDLSQEAFSRVQPYADGAIPRPRALLMTIATNAARELHRRAVVRAPDGAQAASAVTDQAGLAQGAAQFDALLLKQIIVGLPPKLRVVFVLSRFEGLTYPEIAQRLGISTKTVEWRMSKALDLCAARLRD